MSGQRREEQLKVAVIGAGNWGYQHARAFSERADTRLAAVAGRTLERTRARAEQFGVPYYLDIGEMLDREKPDLVSVCLPAQQNFEATLRVIQSGTPLLAEKPLSYDLAQARRLLEEAEKRALFFAIDFNQRYSIPVQMAKQKIEAGELGAPVFALWRFGHGWDGALTHPYLNLIEAQCHGFDMLEYLCGPVESVMAQMTDVGVRGSYTTFSLSLRFRDGAVGSFLATLDADEHNGLSQYIEVGGTKGRMTVEDNVKRFTFQRHHTPTAEVWSAGFFEDRERSFGYNLDRHLDELLGAFRRGERPPVPAERGMRALELAYAAIRSFEEGRSVCVPDETEAV